MSSALFIAFSPSQLVIPLDRFQFRPFFFFFFFFFVVLVFFSFIWFSGGEVEHGLSGLSLCVLVVFVVS